MPTSVVPEEVLVALSEIVDCWPVVIEMARWKRQAITGTMTTIFRDGEPYLLRPQSEYALGPNLGKVLQSGQQPVCPRCGRQLMKLDGHYGNAWSCEGPGGCSVAWSIWELSRRKAFRRESA